MSARNFRFRVVRVQIYVGKNSVVGVPASDGRFVGRKRKLSSDRFAALDNQRRVNAVCFLTSRIQRLFFAFYFFDINTVIYGAAVINFLVSALTIVVARALR